MTGEKIVLPASTIRLMHKIAGEERFPNSKLWTAALQIQTVLDWSLWVRKVEIALIGGDPILLARRITTLLREHSKPEPLRIAILHPGAFSGAPLASLEDPALRQAMGFKTPEDVCDTDAPRWIMRREIDRAAKLLHTRGAGVIAFEMVQGLKDDARNEIVLRLTRPQGQPRRCGIRPSAGVKMQISKADPEGRSSDLYLRSECLFADGLSEMYRQFSGSLSEPPTGQRFADLIIAKRCELLSGFISPPAGTGRQQTREEMQEMVGQPYHFAGGPPLQVSQAVTFWFEDFGRAANNPISFPVKEFEI